MLSIPAEAPFCVSLMSLEKTYGGGGAGVFSGTNEFGFRKLALPESVATVLPVAARICVPAPMEYGVPATLPVPLKCMTGTAGMFEKPMPVRKKSSVHIESTEF